jgi:hypothetical protein
MDSQAVLVLLGIIAFSAVVQGVLLVRLALGGVQLSRRIQELQGRVEREIRPTLDNLTRISRSVAEVSDIAVLQTRRVEGIVADALDRVDHTRDFLRRMAERPAAAFRHMSALVQGVRHGFHVYHRLGSFDAQSRGKSRRYRDDEHLFI